MITIAVIFAIYLISQALIGVIFYNKTKNMSDYALGGRKLNSWVTAMSAQASDMSGWLLIGLPGLAYVVYQGTSEAIWTAIGLALGTYLNWLFVAKKLRKYTEVSNDSITLPDFFENRFRDKKHILRALSAIFTVIFFLIYTAAQFSAGAKLFSTVFGLPYTVGLIIGALIILSYTAFGGFSAVCWADTVQGTIMFFALIIVPIIACSDMGGFSQVMVRLSELTTDSLGIFPMNNGSIDALLLASALGWGLGYFGQPHILVRFMAIESPEQIKKSRVVAMIWVIITLSAAVFIGLIGKAYMPNLVDGETIYMDMINFMFSDVISGLLLIAILAAIMSTASSQLLVTASSVSSDLYSLISKKKMDEMTMVWMSRFTVIVVAAIAILLALNPNSSVFGLVSCAWGGFGAAFGPLILFSLFWRRMTVQGAIAGMIAGGITDLLWYYLKNIAQIGGMFNIYEIIPGFIIASLCIVVVSLCTTPNEEVLAEFDSVK
ncbi:sodium/proline symporter PutP [Anaerovorax sp. IOR16]|uniref:sodium/proline symporter PutP n=1 Tax=Anaerovorax sp. IOR16 TaxID=2773458 RepID=UPI001AD8EF63|nr:sodium/proline symporter PutP [Anaerovorax sp. IOR16]